MFYFFGTVFVVYILLSFYVIYNEYKDFNKCVCKKCGNKLKYFDTDKQYGRGYKCEKCNYFTWVDHFFIDKNYIDTKDKK